MQSVLSSVSKPAVDVVLLTRDASPINSQVWTGIHQQAGVSVRFHRVVGIPRPTDRNRWDTIARARNVGRTLGDSPWIMYVDDDVVLGPGCIARLLRELETKPTLAGIAADYLSERNPHGISPHVAMGATLFRRSVFGKVGFRGSADTCECQSLANDLRRIPLEIDYSSQANATHLELGKSQDRHQSNPAVPRKPQSKINIARREALHSPASHLTQHAPSDSSPPSTPAVLVAFDRRHMGLFAGRFLKQLRTSGNHIDVHAVTYGLRAKDVRWLSRFPNVLCYPQPYTTTAICRARMSGFQAVLGNICPKTPLAYWDAGDVLFQRPLDPLWHIVQADPTKLLVTEEPLPWPKNATQRLWVQQIHSLKNRRKTQQLLHDKPVVNGGFIAGTAGMMKTYFESACRLISVKLKGAGGGDQVVLNCCRYASPEKFRVIDDTWNFCLFGRSRWACRVQSGRYVSLPTRKPVAVVHGNAATLFRMSDPP